MKIESANSSSSDDTNYPVDINYSRSTDKMVALGRYSYGTRGVTSENFPLAGEGLVNINLKLVHPNKTVVSEDVLLYFEQNGLLPARIEELLTFGMVYPDIQREFPIVALGSIWDCPFGPRVPYLYSTIDTDKSSLRGLLLGNLLSRKWSGKRSRKLPRKWYHIFRFLAISK